MQVAEFSWIKVLQQSDPHIEHILITGFYVWLSKALEAMLLSREGHIAK
jgi:hypothetical protein